MLRNRGELDREALDPELNGKIQLNVTATDRGSPPQSSVVTVIINVEVRLYNLLNMFYTTPDDHDNLLFCLNIVLFS